MVVRRLHRLSLETFFTFFRFVGATDLALAQSSIQQLAVLVHCCLAPLKHLSLPSATAVATRRQPLTLG
jgi:hypothetical protein